MVHRVETFREDSGIVVLQSRKVSHLSNISNRFYESSKLKNWMCELCTSGQIYKSYKRTPPIIITIRHAHNNYTA